MGEAAQMMTVNIESLRSSVADRKERMMEMRWKVQGPKAKLRALNSFNHWNISRFSQRGEKSTWAAAERTLWK